MKKTPPSSESRSRKVAYSILGMGILAAGVFFWKRDTSTTESTATQTSPILAQHEAEMNEGGGSY